MHFELVEGIGREEIQPTQSVLLLGVFRVEHLWSLLYTNVNRRVELIGAVRLVGLWILDINIGRYICRS